jgi:predicted RNA polymerase sigma factor
VLREYQPYWALMADLCAKLGRKQAAQAAYEEAIAREPDEAVKRFLAQCRDNL